MNEREKKLQAEALKIVLGIEGTDKDNVIDKLAAAIIEENKVLKLRIPTRYDFSQTEKKEDQGPQQF